MPTERTLAELFAESDDAVRLAEHGADPAVLASALRHRAQCWRAWAATRPAGSMDALGALLASLRDDGAADRLDRR